jgi:beta-galactosidase
MATFEVPYEPGVLKAVGYTGELKAGECNLQTAGAPVGIRLTPDRSTIKTERGDLSCVTVEIVDAAGRINPNAGNMVIFTVTGPGSLAAVGSADPTSTDAYRGNQRHAHQGRCLAVVMSNGQAGEIRLRAQADGLEAAETVIGVQGRE